MPGAITKTQCFQMSQLKRNTSTPSQRPIRQDAKVQDERTQPTLSTAEGENTDVGTRNLPMLRSE